MITTVVLNPAIDKIYFVDDFQVGSMFRVQETLKSPGGKGINVSRVVTALGAEVLSIGFKGGYTGNWLEHQIKVLGVRTDFIVVDGESRTNNNIIDRAKGTETEVLEAGPVINGQDVQKFLCLYERVLEKTKVLVCSGGLPAGLSDDFYKVLIDKAKKFDIKVILDSSSGVLRQGIEAKPYMIKPNLRELGDLVGRELSEIEDILVSCREVQSEGVEIVIASLGEKGALLVSKDKCFRVFVPCIKVVNTIGCGDSMVAGIAVGLSKGWNLEEVIRLGAACGVNNAQYAGIGIVKKDEVFKLLKDIRIEEVDVF